MSMERVEPYDSGKKVRVGTFVAAAHERRDRSRREAQVVG